MISRNHFSSKNTLKSSGGERGRGRGRRGARVGRLLSLSGRRGIGDGGGKPLDIPDIINRGAGGEQHNTDLHQKAGEFSGYLLLHFPLTLSNHK